MKIKDIKISEKNWKHLTQLKLDLGYKNMNELIGEMYNLFIRNYQRSKKNENN